MKAQLTIIVPVFNEEEVLPHLRQSLDQYLRFTPLKSCVLFVDDGSTDRSLGIIKSVCQIDPRFSYISLATNQGLSTALKTGIDLVETRYLGYMDAGLQTSPMDFMLFFRHLEDANMVNGVRVNRKDGFVIRMLSFIANGFRRLLIRDGMIDSCCPFQIIETSYAKKIQFFKGIHRFIPALVQMQGGTVTQVEVSHFRRVAGKAKHQLLNSLFGPFIDTLAVVWMKHNWIQLNIKESSVVPSGHRKGVVE